MSRCIPCVYKKVLTACIMGLQMGLFATMHDSNDISNEGILSLSRLVARGPRRPGLPSIAGAAKSAMSETDLISLSPV